MKLTPVFLISTICALILILLSTSQSYAAACASRVQRTMPGGDTEECSSASLCTHCVDCCTVASVFMMTQEAFRNYRRDFIMSQYYRCPVEPAFKKLADEFRNVYLLRLAAFGSFFDASIFSDTLRDVQVVNTQSLQSYAPSEQICRFGTLSKSLSASEAKVDADRLVLSEMGLAKNLGSKNSASSSGMGQENEARLKVFVDKFCDLQDNNSGLTGLCQSATPVADLQHNRDIDYTRLMGTGATINADLTDTNATQDETSVFALGHSLYGHRQLTKRISTSDIEETGGAINLYSEYRSVVAKRAAAQNSYNTQAAMRMAGSGASDEYMRAMMQQMGISATDALAYLGAKNTDYAEVKSSYNAQMNLLTKQVFQDPAFYANLMESKANVKRSSAALQGIGLMQGRDIYRSMTRSEMLLALIVELEARKISNNVRAVKR